MTPASCSRPAATTPSRRAEGTARASSASPARSAGRPGRSTYTLGVDLLIGERRRPKRPVRLLHVPGVLRPGDDRPARRVGSSRARASSTRATWCRSCARSTASRASCATTAGTRSRTNPLTVPGDRRLASWRPSRRSWALGVRRLGARCRRSARSSSSRVLPAARPRAGASRGCSSSARCSRSSNTEPFGYAVVEVDQAQRPHQRRSSASTRALSTFVKDAPALDGRRRRVHRHAVHLERPRHVRDRPARRPGDVAGPALRRRPVAEGVARHRRSASSSSRAGRRASR